MYLCAFECLVGIELVARGKEIITFPTCDMRSKQIAGGDTRSRRNLLNQRVGILRRSRRRRFFQLTPYRRAEPKVGEQTGCNHQAHKPPDDLLAGEYPVRRFDRESVLIARTVAIKVTA